MPESDRQYRDLAELNPDAITIQVEGKVVYCNKSARRLFRDGETARLIGIDAIQLVDPDFREFILKRRNRVLSTGEPAPYIETRHLRLDGTSFPSETVVGRVNWGGRAGTLIIIHDITERKEAEEALKKSEARLLKAAEMAKISYWVWDEIEDKAIYCSEEGAKLYGVASGAELTAMLSSHAADLEWVHPDDRERFDQAVRTARETKRGCDIEYRIVNAAGEIRHLHLIEEPVLDERGKIIRSNGIIQDITERKQAEESSRQLIAAINAMNEAVVFFDADDRLVFSNQRHREINSAAPETLVPGIAFEDQMKVTLARGLIPEAQGREDEWLRERLDRHRRPKGPFELLRQDGIWLLVHEQRLSDGGMITLATDITERKRTEEALRTSEEKFFAALNNSSEAIALYDTDDRLVLWNEVYQRHHSGLMESLLKPGLRFEDLVRARACSGESPTAIGREEDYVAERLERHQNPGESFETQRKDGWYRYREHRTPDGGTMIVISDITDLKQRETELIKAQEIAKVGSWIWHLDDGGMIKVSGEYLRIIGFPPDQPPKNQAEVNRHIHPDDLERTVKILDGAANTPSDYEVEYRFVRPDGEIRHIVELGELIYDDRGRAIGHAGTIQDMTELKRSEEQLRQAQKMEAVGQLTAGVAHDFNNMLAVIWLNAELLEDELGADNPQLAAVSRAAKRAADLTQRLLAFSRKQVLKPEIVNTNSLIADITGLLRRTLEEHIDIEAVAGAGLWNCEVDPAQLENALVNLAINARDAMPEGGKLTIETANVRLDDDTAAAQAEVTPGQYVMLAVTDTGTGMPPEVREHIFEPFFTTKEVGKGTGLGLSMIYGFVKQSGGHVTVTSEEGEGTTFKLYLPRSSKTEAVERKPVTDEVPVARGETVLVVEDDPDLRTLAVALLGNLGYQVIEAATGPAALEQLGSTTRVNLLLTDVVMPGGMNGRELATEVERRAPGIKVLYMSGYTEDAIIRHGRLDAAAELMQKPFSRADLAQAVRRILNGPSD